MKVLETTRVRATVELSAEEVHMVNNALNEICNGIDIAEFEVRLGLSRPEVTETLSAVQRLWAQMSLG